MTVRPCLGPATPRASKRTCRTVTTSSTSRIATRSIWRSARGRSTSAPNIQTWGSAGHPRRGGCALHAQGRQTLSQVIDCPLPGKTKVKETTETRMTFQNFTIDTDADGIALVTWNMPGRSMNVIDEKVMEELGAIVEQVAADGGIKGAVLTSGK